MRHFSRKMEEFDKFNKNMASLATSRNVTDRALRNVPEFGEFLASRRNPRPRLAVRNPAADELVAELQQHLKVIEYWLSGDMNRGKMLGAMEFFAREFPGRFSVSDGAVVYRGQSQPVFDGTPRSYSHESKVAKDFACDLFMSNSYVIRRQVCHGCADKAAFRLTLDMGKVLKAYAGHKFGNEKEVVILNTEPKKPAEVLTVDCKKNPRKGAFERCVKSVEKRGGVDDPKAVCAAAISKKRGRTKGRVNPEDGAARLAESFHGAPAEKVTEIRETVHEHEWLATLGWLISCIVITPTDLEATIFFPHECIGDRKCEICETKPDDDIHVAPDSAWRPRLASSEDGRQLYFEGGNQSVDLKPLEMDGKEWAKDLMVLGVLVQVTYETKKKFDKFKLTDYYHDLGEETGEQPMMLFDTLNERCSVAGGQYKIKVPLVGMSPGIEN